jgi:hypothetical protein
LAPLSVYQYARQTGGFWKGGGGASRIGAGGRRGPRRLAVRSDCAAGAPVCSVDTPKSVHHPIIGMLPISAPNFSIPGRSRSLTVTGMLCGLLLIAGPAQGQDLQWGFSGGVTTSQFLGDASAFAAFTPAPPLSFRYTKTELPAEFTGRRTGFVFGINVRTALTKRITARTAINYVQQGGVVDRTVVGPADGLVDETAEYRLDYLRLPLLVQVGLPRRTVLGLQPSLYVGPGLGFPVRARVARTDRTGGGGQRFTTDVETAAVTVSAVAGGEVAYPFPRGGEVALTVRYQYGLTDVTSASCADARLGTLWAGLIVRYAR